MKASPVILRFALLNLFLMAIIPSAPAQVVIISNPLFPPPWTGPSIPTNSPPPPGNDCVTPPTGLVGWWKGDGSTLDSVSGNNGVNQNVGYTNGVVGRAFAFDPENFAFGTYTGIQIADQPAYALTNSLTIEGWICPLGDSYMIFWRGDNRPGLDPYYLSMQDNHTLRFGICDAAGNPAFVDTTLNYSLWTHVAATLDGSSGTLSIYTNGVLAAHANTNIRPFGHLLPDQSPGIGIGNVNDGANNFPFIGNIDEISLYARALSVGEIQAIYNSASAGKCAPTNTSTNDCVTPPTGLVSWWKGEGNANDSVGDNNGVNQNVTYTTGVDGRAFNFDGSASSYISVPASSNLDIGATGSGITIEGWINCDFSGSASMPIVEWDAATDGLQLWAGTPYNLFMNIKDTAGNSHIFSSPDYSVSTNTWQHMAATYSKDTGLAVLYINGIAAASQNFGNITPQTTYPLNIGRRTGQTIGLNQTFHGQLDELSLYNRALSVGEIQAIYNAGSAGKCASTPSFTGPHIFNINPAIATNGTMITISGINFASNTASNIVYFGAVQANVLSSTTTNLVVRVPVGATYAPVTVTIADLTAYSGQLFEPTFIGDGTADISQTSFASRLDLPAGKGPIKTVIADIDGDGKPDLIVANCYGNTISIYRNISTGGPLTADSFAPKVDLQTPSGGQNSPYNMAVADINGDGKLDIVVIDYDDSLVSVYQNNCTSGNISSNTFLTRVDLPCGFQPQGIDIKDIDGDGHPDIVTANRGDGTLSILQNISTGGIITTNSFMPHIDIPTGSSCDSVVIGDLDGDGKPDIAVANTDDGTVSVLRNLSSPGSITEESFAPKVDITVASPLIQMTIGDADGDGKLDLIVAASAPHAVYVLRNNSSPGNLSFDAPTSFSLTGWGHNPALADLNGDGKLDLAVATELNSALSIFQNVGELGTFTASSLASRVDLSTGWNAWGVVAGDLDGDGRPDLVFANSYDNTISIYQNQTPLLATIQQAPPTITSQPLSQTVLQGASATFSVTATGPGSLTYQWKLNKVNISKATSATLTLTNLHPAQAGNYTVTVSNPNGSVTSSNALLTVTAQNVLIYNYSGSEKVTTAKQEFSYNYSGQMFFIPGSTNGVFIGWATISGKKQYWVSAFSDYLLATIPGAANHIYTVLGKAGNNIDGNGQPHIWSYLHKGLNTTLSVANKKTFSFPNTFTCNDSHVYPDPQTGVMILREASSTYTYTTQTTQTANNSGQTLADLVNALTQSLAKQGYKPQ